MIYHKISEMSESEEMYLITVARLVEAGLQEPIPISQLAEELQIQPVSANQMVHKLVEEGLMAYLPYKGVKLTDLGLQIASGVLRHRRLWEVFLVEHLGVAPSEADALACRFEHITPRPVINRLDEFLGHPPFSAQGSPIPTENGDLNQEDIQVLKHLSVGQSAEVIRIGSDKGTRSFLETVGLRPGIFVCPLAVSDSGPMLLKFMDSHIQLASEVTEEIMVRIAGPSNDEIRRE